MYIDPTPYPDSITVMFDFWSVAVFVIGTCFGSFLNVCIWRMPRDESIVSPSSRCPKCGHELAWFENFPIIGWLSLRGKCKECKQPISVQYLLMELLTGIMFLGVWFRVYYTEQYVVALVPYLIITSLVITTFFIDIKHYIIPNETTYFTMITGLLCAAVFPELWPATSWWWALGQSAICMAIGGGLLGIFALIGEWMFKQEALGWGDVKYIAAISAMLGLKCAFFTVLIGSILGSIVGVALVVFKKKGVKTTIPFGPYLAVATYVWIFCGHEVTEWYFALMGPVE